MKCKNNENIHAHERMYARAFTHGVHERYDIKYNGYLIFNLCSFNLKPSISEKTPDNADKITSFIIVYKYGLADNPDILKGLSNS